tara:strand:+ start:3762 stop:4535 length:774 start_codon:yes stop_codon:yes gene_type:complete
MQLKVIKNIIYILFTMSCFLVLWECISRFSSIPRFLLPSPADVGLFFKENYITLGQHSYVTFKEVFLSLVVGCFFAFLFALSMLMFPFLQRAFNPIFVMSQCIPTFAIAPLIILWLGFGVASKVVIASLMIFFPMTTNAYDGLSQTPKDYLQLAHTMNSNTWTSLRYIRIPAALPMIATGIKISVVIAPIGAVIGEWSGSSEGLGHFMMYCNSRMEVAGMFAALITLSLGAISLFYATDYSLKKALFWVHDTTHSLQ